MCNAASSLLNKAAEERDIIVAVEDDGEASVHIDIGVGRTNESTVVERATSAASAMMRRRR